MSLAAPLAGSFRDPSGHIFVTDGVVYRQVSYRYKANYDLLINSGFYESAVRSGLLIPHEEVSNALRDEDAYKIIRPRQIDTISYPYEWSFSQLKDAAILTLELQRVALEHGVWLKDASAYNVQFVGSKPIFIDTLSFEKLPDGQPWVAYRQFCRHFLAPLALMALVDIRLGRSLQLHIDGIPLDFAAGLLPWKTKLNPGLAMHLIMHAKADKMSGNAETKTVKKHFKLVELQALCDNLKSTIERLTWTPGGTEWGNYYSETNYSDTGMNAKRSIVKSMLEEIHPKKVWDIGANTGEFSRLASALGSQVVSWDIDPAAVEKHYLAAKQASDELTLPLLTDLANPSPGIGWGLQERDSIFDRGSVDVVMALALVHHLAIGNNVPLPKIFEVFYQLGKNLIIEFVPKVDSQVVRLLRSREDIFTQYTQEGFEHALSDKFEILRVEQVPDTSRTLYLARGRT